VTPEVAASTEAMTSEDIYDRLKMYADIGIIQYVLPTNPLGEQWILGIDDLGIAKLIGDGQAVSFIVGTENAIKIFARQRGLL